MYSHGGMTESPKPLSPSGGLHPHPHGHESSTINRQRSPSLTTQFQQQHFGRRQSGRGSTPPTMSLPSPHSSSQGPKLPALSGLAPPEPRYTLSSQVNAQQNTSNSAHMVQQSQSLHPGGSNNPTFQPQMSGSTAPRGPPGGPAHHQGSGSGDSSNNMFASGDRGTWTYIQTLQDKIKELHDRVSTLESVERSQDEKIRSQDEKINRLSDELNALRIQVGGQNHLPNGTGLARPQQ